MTLSISESQIRPSSDKEVVLSVEGVSKKFCRSLKHSLFYGIQDIASDIAGMRSDKRDLRNKEFWALDNVSFELRRGEALGLVGKNGSGKSTLLRIIAGLIKPDKGQVRVRGTVAPLIALGAGFNPVLTGRENVYANMSILGLTKQEIDERFDAVVEFAEIGEAIDAPVRSYSSGMAARLGFASAIYTEPDILLIDEVLAVGDINFRAKCHRKLEELKKKDTSFILVSHQSQAILNVCETAVYLSYGKQIAVGTAISIMSRYEKDLLLRGTEINSGFMSRPPKPEHESLGLDIISLSFKDREENILQFPISGEPTLLCVGCKVLKKLENTNLYLVIREINSERDIILHLSTFFDDESLTLTSGECEIRVDLPCLGLKPGSYMMTVFIKQNSLYILDLVENFEFKVDGEGNSRNLFYQPRQWKIIYQNS